MHCITYGLFYKENNLIILGSDSNLVNILNKLAFYTTSVHKDAGFILWLHNDDKKTSVKSWYSYTQGDSFKVGLGRMCTCKYGCKHFLSVCHYRRFAASGAMTAEEQEQRILYTNVLEYEQDHVSNHYKYVKTKERCHYKLPGDKVIHWVALTRSDQQTWRIQYMIIWNAKSADNSVLTCSCV